MPIPFSPVGFGRCRLPPFKTHLLLHAHVCVLTDLDTLICPRLKESLGWLLLTMGVMELRTRRLSKFTKTNLEERNVVPPPS